MPKDVFNRSLDFNAKLKYFLSCYLIIWIIFQDAIGKFLTILNNKKVVNLGHDFNSSGIFWTDKPLWNIIKLLIVCALAFLFGVAYSYMARKIRGGDKVTLSMLNAIAGVFGYLLIVFAVIALFRNDALHDTFVAVRDILKENSFYLIFIVLQLIGVGSMTFVGIKTGQKLIRGVEEEEKGRLLGIKWFHYVWLSPAISIYIQSFLFLIYLTVPTIGLFFHNFHWGDLLGNNTGGSYSNSISSLVWGLVILYIIAVAIFYLIRLQRDILISKVKMSLIYKILISILVSFVIPIILIFFTAIGQNS